MTQTTKPYDLVCFGRVAVDLYAEQIHSSLQDVQTFRKYLGGCAGNIAVGTARLGLNSLMLSKVGQDAMGDFVINTLQHEGVETHYIKQDPKHLTGLVLLGVSPPDHFPLMFYREQCADMQMTLQDCQLPWDKAKAVLLTGTGFSTLPMRNVSRLVLNEARAHNSTIILDLDFRPVLWGLTNKGDGETRYQPSQEIAKHYTPFLKQSDLVVGTEEEFLIASEAESLEKAIQTIQGLTQAILVVKKGENGCEIIEGKTRILCPGFPVKVMNVLGAGDAFLSGFLKAWLEGKSLKLCGHYGNAAGAIVVSRHGCSPAMPYHDELEFFLTQSNSQEAVYSSQLRRLHRQPSIKLQKDDSLAMLAFDHRTPFEQSLENTDLPLSIIEEFKQQVYKGFCRAKSQNQEPAFRLGCLVDPIYGSAVLSQLEAKSLVAVPIEAANTSPLAWIEDKPLYEQILARPSSWLVKVLVHFNSSMSLSHTQAQMKQLTLLSQVCEQLNRSWILELLSDELESSMKTLYQRGIEPTWWKIPAPKTQWEWERLSLVVKQHDSKARFIVLGGEHSIDSLKPFLALARQNELCQGFALGRPLFWSTWVELIQGEITIEQVSQRIEENFLNLLNLWRQAPNHEIRTKEGSTDEVLID